jgi:hypothetical protein
LKSASAYAEDDARHAEALANFDDDEDFDIDSYGSRREFMDDPDWEP